MATLQNIALTGFTGTAPTPVAQRAINRYLVNDGLMNLMEFTNIAMGSNIGNLQASFVYYNGDGAEAAFRKIGVEYSADNETPLTETVTLKQLGGNFATDRVLARAFSNNPGAVSNWTEQQIGQKLNKITNGFAKYFMLGNSSTDALQFDGLNKFFTKFTGQVATDAFDISAGMDEKMAIRVERYLNTYINKVKPGRPNVLITTEEGKTLLQTLNAYRHRNVNVVEVNSKQYNEYIGIPICALTNSCFDKTTQLDKGIPVIFGYIDEFDGIRTAVPIDGNLIDIVRPELGDGVFVKTGGVELVAAPMFPNPFCASQCFISETTV